MTLSSESTETTEVKLAQIRLTTEQHVLYKFHRVRLYQLQQQKEIRAFIDRHLEKKGAIKFLKLAYFIAADAYMKQMRTGESIPRDLLKDMTVALEQLLKALLHIKDYAPVVRNELNKMYIHSLPTAAILDARDKVWVKINERLGKRSEGFFIDRIESLYYATGNMLRRIPTSDFLKPSMVVKKGPSGTHFPAIDQAVSLWAALWETALGKKATISVKPDSSDESTCNDPFWLTGGEFVEFVRLMLKPFHETKLNRQTGRATEEDKWTRQIKNGLSLLRGQVEKRNGEKYLISYLGHWTTYGSFSPTLEEPSGAQENSHGPKTNATDTTDTTDTTHART